jgi:hypothetical protein
MLSLLSSKAIKKPDQGRSSNSLNGSDAETLAATSLVKACLGEIRWGSREEDGSKIDLLLSYSHPWLKGERVILLVQVKSGSTYGETTGKGFKLKTSALAAAKRTSHSICIIWIDRDTSKEYWAYIHPNTLYSPREYGEQHKVNPATLYDLTRCATHPSNRNIGGRGVIIRQRSGNFRDRRKTVNDGYRNQKTAISPVMGTIEFTRYGWRHMFRSNRSAKYKQSSIEVIPYLPNILKHHPSAHAITDIKTWEAHDYIYRSSEHLLKFSEAQFKENSAQPQKAEVIIKLMEEIRYPKNWRTEAMLSQKISRRVVLKSAYCKRENS